MTDATTDNGRDDELWGRRWCERCRTGVEPAKSDFGLECPRCGRAV